MSFKRLFRVLLCTLITVLPIPHTPVFSEGEDPDFSDTEYWNRLCTASEDLTDEDAENCKAYTQYMQERNSQLQSQIADIDSRREQISSAITDYANQIASFNAQIAGINSMIDDLNAQITAVEEQIADIQSQIAAKETAIHDKQEEVDSLKEKVAERMAEGQKTMRTYQFLDVLMGAKSFDDFIRLANGISDIYAYDSHSLTQLNDSINELTDMQAQLVADRENIQMMEAQLKEGKEALDSQQASLLSARYELQILEQSYSQQLAKADSEKANAEAAIAGNQSQIGAINDSIANRPTPTPTPKPTPTPAASSDSSSNEPAPAASSQPEKTAEASASPASPASSPEPSSAPTPASSSSESFETPDTQDTSGNPYYGGWSNCTWGTWQLVHDTLGISLPGWGMAGNWLNDAAASGYATGSTPRVNSIAVYSYHVAFVTAVDGDRVYIKEGNYLGRYYERWVPAAGLPYTGQTCLGYIYL